MWKNQRIHENGIIFVLYSSCHQVRTSGAVPWLECDAYRHGSGKTARQKFLGWSRGQNNSLEKKNVKNNTRKKNSAQRGNIWWQSISEIIESIQPKPLGGLTFLSRNWKDSDGRNKAGCTYERMRVEMKHKPCWEKGINLLKFRTRIYFKMDNKLFSLKDSNSFYTQHV